MKADEFDKAFDDGEDITEALDLKQAERPGLKSKRINVDFPTPGPPFIHTILFASC